MALAAQDELAEEQVAGRDLFARFVQPGLVEEGEAVAPADVALEVHREREDLDGAGEHRQRHIRSDGGEIEAGLNLPLGPAPLHGERLLHAPGSEDINTLFVLPGKAHLYPHPPLRREVEEAQAAGAPGDGAQVQRLPRAQIARVVDFAQGRNDPLARLAVNPRINQRMREGVAPGKGDAQIAPGLPRLQKGEALGLGLAAVGRPNAQRSALGTGPERAPSESRPCRTRLQAPLEGRGRLAPRPLGRAGPRLHAKQSP